MQSPEKVLLQVVDCEEVRRVTVIEGESLAVLEESYGPMTEVAYGTPRHGHKILCAYEVCARVLGADALHVADALNRFFAREGVFLSDFMDRFDAEGERYTYLAWGADGEAVYRPAHEIE